MDNLEKYILTNREDFDSQSPPKSIWEKIDKNLQPKKSKRITLWSSLRIAASVLLLLAAGAMGGIYFSNTQINDQAANSKVQNDFLEVESYFQDEINQRIVRLTSMNQYDESVQSDLTQIDEFLEELKSEIKAAPAGKEEQIISAMINNYQTKIDVLEKIIDKINSNKNINSKKEKDETINL